MGNTPGSGLDGGTSGDWMVPGQVMLWAVRLLRFPAGELSCSMLFRAMTHHNFLESNGVNLNAKKKFDKKYIVGSPLTFRNSNKCLYPITLSVFCRLERLGGNFREVF